MFSRHRSGNARRKASRELTHQHRGKSTGNKHLRCLATGYQHFSQLRLQSLLPCCQICVSRLSKGIDRSAQLCVALGRRHNMQLKGRFRRRRDGTCKRNAQHSWKTRGQTSEAQAPLIADLMPGGRSARATVTAAAKTKKARNMTANRLLHVHSMMCAK